MYIHTALAHMALFTYSLGYGLLTTQQSLGDDIRRCNAQSILRGLIASLFDVDSKGSAGLDEVGRGSERQGEMGSLEALVQSARVCGCEAAMWRTRFVRVCAGSRAQ